MWGIDEAANMHARCGSQRGANAGLGEPAPKGVRGRVTWVATNEQA
jgi:hypothetical protein